MDLLAKPHELRNKHQCPEALSQTEPSCSWLTLTRSCSIEPNLSATKPKFRLSAALGMNHDKWTFLFIHKSARIKLIYCAYEVVISMPFPSHQNQDSSSLHLVPRCAQTRQLWQIGRTKRFCTKYITEKKWRQRLDNALYGFSGMVSFDRDRGLSR